MAFTLQPGQRAVDFDLPGTDGQQHSLKEFQSARVLVVVFSCNHCPYVIGSEDRMIEFANAYGPKGVALVAINSNETDNHPADSLEHMIRRAREKKFPFPYLRDETQEIARAYGAMRTPHFFAFVRNGKGDLVLGYTGRMDDNPRIPGAQKTHELTDAVNAMLRGVAPVVPMTNPIGCNVKWKGKAEKWMPPEACDLV